MSNFLLHSAKARYQRGSMHYLQRDERREGIMQAAMRLALRGGFSAMTVRQIAREAQVAAGQLHHHFASIGELKSRVHPSYPRDARHAAGGRGRQLARAVILDDRQRG